VIAVVGAGPAGLAAAWRAAQGGHDVVVLERAPVVGGMAGSFDVAGLRVDHGSHRLHPATPAPILAALRNLLGPGLQERHRHACSTGGSPSPCARPTCCAARPTDSPPAPRSTR
jgi:phytoene dehydrogenase-like protein